jgi:hypothetical protein
LGRKIVQDSLVFQTSDLWFPISAFSVGGQFSSRPFGDILSIVLLWTSSVGCDKIIYSVGAACAWWCAWTSNPVGGVVDTSSVGSIPTRSRQIFK